MVYPEDPRWSDNWESNSVRKYTQTNLPGELHQDDLASGDDPRDPEGDRNPVDKQRYPDFAIVAEGARSFRYRKLYFVNFTTNEGFTSDGRAIYSAQATHRAIGGEQDYCTIRGWAYKSCMFSRAETCYAQRRISDPSLHTRIDWAAALGYLSRIGGKNGVESEHPDQVEAHRQITTLCDPRPPGSGQT